jgi:hypothetical protein
MEEDRMPKMIFSQELEGPRRRRRLRKRRKEEVEGSSCARSEEMQRAGDR